MKNCIKRKKVKGFTLVELLSVIVILAIILVIAVPKVMSIIKDSKKATLESTVKMIASSAEKQKVQNTVLGNTDTITCESIVKINDLDYEGCDVNFDENIAKVTIKGVGNFEGLWVCNGTKTNAKVQEESCGLITLTVILDGGTDTVDYNAKYEAGSAVTLISPIKEGYTFVNWIVESGEGASVNGNTLIMGTTSTKVKAIWEEERNFSTDSLSTIVAAVKQAEANGTKYPYNVGETRSIELGYGLGTHIIRVANTTRCSALEIEPVSKTACGFVLEFADIIITHAINGIDTNTSTNVGGWPASEIRKYLNDIDLNDSNDGVIYNALPDDLKNKIIDTYVVSGYGNEVIEEYENVVDGNFYSIDKLYLLSTYEVWGSNPEGNDTAATNTITRQLDYYAKYEGDDYLGVSIENFGGAIKKNGLTPSFWWLRSARFGYSRSFYRVGSSGDWNYNGSYISNGVSPAFRLAN